LLIVTARNAVQSLQIMSDQAGRGWKNGGVWNYK